MVPCQSRLQKIDHQPPQRNVEGLRLPCALLWLRLYAGCVEQLIELCPQVFMLGSWCYLLELLLQDLGLVLLQEQLVLEGSGLQAGFPHLLLAHPPALGLGAVQHFLHGISAEGPAATTDLVGAVSVPASGSGLTGLPVCHLL